MCLLYNIWYINIVRHKNKHLWIHLPAFKKLLILLSLPMFSLPDPFVFYLNVTTARTLCLSSSFSVLKVFMCPQIVYCLSLL